MQQHHLVFIGLLSALLLPKRTRYASFVYLVPYIIYLLLYHKGLIPDSYYFAVSATLNTIIFLALFKGYKLTSINDIFNLNKYTINQKVGLLSVLLVLINFVGYCRWYYGVEGFQSTIYDSDYRFIVGIQISLLYIGNMIDAFVDRRDHKLALLRFADIDYFETFEEILTDEKE